MSSVLCPECGASIQTTMEKFYSVGRPWFRTRVECPCGTVLTIMNPELRDRYYDAVYRTTEGDKADHYKQIIKCPECGDSFRMDYEATNWDHKLIYGGVCPHCKVKVSTMVEAL